MMWPMDNIQLILIVLTILANSVYSMKKGDEYSDSYMRKSRISSRKPRGYAPVINMRNDSATVDALRASITAEENRASGRQRPQLQRPMGDYPDLPKYLPAHGGMTGEIGSSGSPEGMPPMGSTMGARRPPGPSGPSGAMNPMNPMNPMDMARMNNMRGSSGPPAGMPPMMSGASGSPAGMPTMMSGARGSPAGMPTMMSGDINPMNPMNMGSDYDRGYSAGRTAGYTTGYNAGSNMGYLSGSSAAHNPVSYEEHTPAFDSGYQDGYYAGYNEGLTNGKNENFY